MSSVAVIAYGSNGGSGGCLRMCIIQCRPAIPRVRPEQACWPVLGMLWHRSVLQPMPLWLRLSPGLSRSGAWLPEWGS